MEKTAEGIKARFDDFELDLSSGELIRGGRRIRVQAQPFQVLCVLLERAGAVVTREELQSQLWPGAAFGDFDHGLNKAVAKLRDALEDSKESSRLIETIPRRGYRFTAPVNWVSTESSPKELPVMEAKNNSFVEPVVPLHQSAVRYCLAGGLLLILLATTMVLFNRRATIAAWLGIQRSRSVAVLPLVNLSNDPEEDYFADGITEQLTTDLSYAKPLRVLSRSSTIRFKGSHLSVPEIADQLHVDALIEGTVLRDHDTIRVTLRLTAASPERQLWAASYERNVNDAILLQNQLAADAVNQMRTQLTPEGRAQLNLESRINPEAYDEYLRARFFLHQETAQKNRAIPHLERAIQLDPGFAAAYAALGEAWGLEGVWGDSGNRESSPKALEYSQKAVSLDPTSSEAYSSLGHSLMQNRQWNKAEAALRRAIELDPNYPYAADYLALELSQKGRVDESLQISRELALANPVSVDFQRTYANMLFRARRYDEAIDECERLIELDPNHLTIYVTYANSLVQKGRYREAEAAFNKGNLLNPGIKAWLYALEGNTASAHKVLEEHASSPVNPHTAVAHYLLGEQEIGLTELDHLANDVWNTRTYNLRNDPTFDPMRSDPRFAEIVKRTGLLDN